MILTPVENSCFDEEIQKKIKQNAEKIREVLEELQRAKRASEEPWVRNIGNPSSRENLVMTSAYERASERTSAQTRG